MKFGNLLAISCATLMLTLGCASHRNKTEIVDKSQASDLSQNQQAAVAMDRNIVSSIDFEPGRRALSPEATAELNRAIMEAKQRGQVGEVDIAVWSDMEYPAGQGQKLPDQQINIAKERGANIEKYLDRMEPGASVKVHNMARQPSTFADFLHTQDSEVKNKLAAMGVSTDATGTDVKGRSSSALVMIKLK